MRIRYWKNIGLNGRTTLLMFFPLVTAILIFGYFVTIDRIDSSEEKTQQKNELLVRYYSSMLELSMIAQDVKSLVSYANVILKEQSVINVLIEGENKLYIFKENKKALERNGSVKYYVSDIELSGISVGGIENDLNSLSSAGEGNVIGMVRIGVVTDDIIAEQYEIIIIGLLSTFIGVLISALVSFRISKIITKPVLRLNDAVNLLTAGNLSTRVTEVSVGELGALERGINNMAVSLHDAQIELVGKIEKATNDLNLTVVELEQRNKDLDELRHQAEILGDEKSQFLARMSHELRTPLNAVIGFSRLIGGDVNQQEKSDYAKTIIDSATQLTTIIDDILTFSKINSGSLHLVQEFFSPKNICENSIIMLANEAYKKNIELILLINEGIPDMIVGDKIRFHQVLTNLINNAIKFTRQGEVLVEVSTILLNNVNMLQVLVTDTGCGINSESIDNIFKEFSQSRDISTRRSGGVGLGLSISQQLAKMMGGGVTVVSELGEGSQFSFHVPLLQYKNQAGALTVLQTKCRTILIDPHYKSRKSLEKMLKICGINVLSFQSESDVKKCKTITMDFDLLVVSIPQDLTNYNGFIENISIYIETFNGTILLLHNGNNCHYFLSVNTKHSISFLSKPLRQEKLSQSIHNLLSSEKVYNKKNESNKKITNVLNNGGTILIVEDNLYNQKLISIMLKNRGVKSLVTTSGNEAIEALDLNSFSLILMDLHLPENDGVSIARQIRKSNTVYANIPIVLLTADVLYDAASLIDEGVVNYIMYKPVAEDVLDDVLEQYCVISSAQASLVTNKSEFKKIDKSLKNEVIRLCDIIHRHLKKSEVNVKEVKETIHQLVGIVGYYQLDSIKALTFNMQKNIRDEDISLFIKQFNKLEIFVAAL